jgi:hypothetical protein
MPKLARTKATSGRRPGRQITEHRERRKQAFWAVKALGPRVLSTANTPYNLAASIAFPEYPNLPHAMVALLGYRVTADSIRRWRNGLRPAPQWAIDILAEHLRTRARKMLEIAYELENQKQKRL